MSIGEQLRNPVLVRLADPLTEPVIDWCQANSERNAFDRDVLTYPSTKTLAAHNNGEVYAYLPIQGTVMLESVGPNPGSSPIQVTQAMIELVKGAALLAHQAGYRELYYLVSDDNTAKAGEYMGFEELPYRVMRKRL